MTTPFHLIPIEAEDDVFDLPETELMCSVYNDKPNITKDLLIHFLKGKPIVDLTDGEYIHFLQLDEEAKKYADEHLNI